jgi:NAD-dependent dihydropyrimidine dehydrogenase PreA subunit
MGIESIDREICKGCGICFSVCPQDVLRMDEESTTPKIVYPEDCVACWACEMFCPVDAIHVTLDQPMRIPSPWQGLLGE